MKSININSYTRYNTGKFYTKELKRNFKVPCVLYSKNKVSHLYIKYHNINSIIHSTGFKLINLLINDENNVTSIIQDIQFHPVNDQVLHIDFMEVNESTITNVNIPIKIIGKAPGIIKGGKLYSNIRFIKVKGTISDLLDYIEIDISNLNIGDSIKIKNLKLNKLQVLNHINTTIVKIFMSKAMISDEKQITK